MVLVLRTDLRGLPGCTWIGCAKHRHILSWTWTRFRVWPAVDRCLSSIPSWGLSPHDAWGNGKRPTPGLPRPAVLRLQAFSASWRLVPPVALLALFHASNAFGVSPSEVFPPTWPMPPLGASSPPGVVLRRGKKAEDVPVATRKRASSWPLRPRSWHLPWRPVARTSQTCPTLTEVCRRIRSRTRGPVRTPAPPASGGYPWVPTLRARFLRDGRRTIAGPPTAVGIHTRCRRPVALRYWNTTLVPPDSAAVPWRPCPVLCVAAWRSDRTALRERNAMPGHRAPTPTRSCRRWRPAVTWIHRQSTAAALRLLDTGPGRGCPPSSHTVGALLLRSSTDPLLGTASRTSLRTCFPRGIRVFGRAHVQHAPTVRASRLHVAAKPHGRGGFGQKKHPHSGGASAVYLRLAGLDMPRLPVVKCRIWLRWIDRRDRRSSAQPGFCSPRRRPAFAFRSEDRPTAAKRRFGSRPPGSASECLCFAPPRPSSPKSGRPRLCSTSACRPDCRWTSTSLRFDLRWRRPASTCRSEDRPISTRRHLRLPRPRWASACRQERSTCLHVAPFRWAWATPTSAFQSEDREASARRCIGPFPRRSVSACRSEDRPPPPCSTPADSGIAAFRPFDPKTERRRHRVARALPSGTARPGPS